MLSRRNMLSTVATGIATVGIGRGAQTKQDNEDRSGWIPQLNRTAKILADAESGDDRFSPEVVHRADFLPGVTMLLHRTETGCANARLQSVQTRLARQGILTSQPGRSEDESTWVLFACADRKAVETGLRATAIRV